MLRRVVVVGGGFGGLAVAKQLRGAPVEVLLIDRRNHHLFQPLLYQVATGALSPANIAVPLRSLLRRGRNTHVLMASVEDVDLEAQELLLDDGQRLAYDALVIAVGSETSWYGHEEWEGIAPGLKSIEDATAMRARILGAFEAAELEPEHARAWLSFAVIGGGPTGVELAGAIAELARDTLRHDFRSVDPRSARVHLIEGAEQVLPSYPASLARRAQRALERLPVQVHTHHFVTAIDAEGVTLRDAGASADAPARRVDARTVLWAAGVRAVPLVRRVAERAGVPVDRGGRVAVTPHLALPGYPGVFVIGDAAASSSPDGGTLPGIAPVAIQQGRYVGNAILQRSQDTEPAPFRYRERGLMATIGRGQAVFYRGPVKLGGFVGWLGWLFVHLLQLSAFENRLLVLTQWAWSYATHNRAARLIIGWRTPRG